MSETQREPPPVWRFPTTHWSCVAEAGDPDPDRSRAALAELCGAYWYPLYAFVRRRGHAADDAADMVQGYFVRLLERGVLVGRRPRPRAISAFLMADCAYHLSHERAGSRLKSGGAGGRPSRSTCAKPRAGSSTSRPTT